MARALRRPVAALAALQLLQWLGVAALARSAGGPGTGLVLLQVVVLLPLALASVYVAAEAVAGRAVGLFAAAVWALGPFAAVPFWDGRYRRLYTHEVLASVVGLRDDPGFRAMALVAVGLALLTLALRRGGTVAAGTAGLAFSVAAALDVRVVIALGVPALVLLAARRPRAAAVAAAGIVPGVIAVALAGGVPGFPADGAAWAHLHANQLGFQEYFWSMRVLEWLPLAGAIGLARRSLPLAAGLLALVAGWLVVTGSAAAVTFGSGTFLTALLPAAPAYLLLAGFVPLLAPPLPSPRRLLPSASR